MTLKTFKPYTKSTRGTILVDRTGLWKGKPFKSLVSPKNAMMLLNGTNTLHVMDLQQLVGKSSSKLERIKGRIIGEDGAARRNIENLSDTTISIYGKTVSVIGSPNQLKTAIDAISSLSSGSMHGAVYSKLEAVRRRENLEKLQLWENQDVF